jgi:hypothetical protein
MKGQREHFNTNKDKNLCNHLSDKRLVSKIYRLWAQWLKPVIPVTWEAEIRRIVF